VCVCVCVDWPESCMWMRLYAHPAAAGYCWRRRPKPRWQRRQHASHICSASRYTQHWPHMSGDTRHNNYYPCTCVWSDPYSLMWQHSRNGIFCSLELRSPRDCRARAARGPTVHATATKTVILTVVFSFFIRVWPLFLNFDCNGLCFHHLSLVLGLFLIPFRLCVSLSYDSCAILTFITTVWTLVVLAIINIT